ncbi:MAG: M48 family metallopeptidase [Candidatus Thermoplasmatota archaeon]|nr:M48 family metallopeptidase [Candidatus Thermoplasmatota archaeon]MCL5990073.1 M48 family metallopeptidase [Candidatus Thermoplasmatota archaeon]
MFPDKVIRSNRKTVSLQINENAELVVRVPNQISTEKILQIVEQNSNWIARNRRAMLFKISESQPKKFIEGEEFLYLGKSFKLKISRKSNDQLHIEDDHFILGANILDRRKAFLEWYRNAAFSKLSERTAIIARNSELKYSAIKITSAQKRWGSCSRDGGINYTWRLVMAPIPIIDYVVLHELAHTVARNHSSRFWNIVKKNMPDYPIRQKWLRDNVFNLRI